MKVNEILTEYSPAIENWKEQKRLAVLASKLRRGQMVNVVNAYFKQTSQVNDMFSWGELEKLGFAHREKKPGPGKTEVETRWVFTGPTGSSIRVHTTGSSNPQLLTPGDATDWLIVDVS